MSNQGSVVRSSESSDTLRDVIDSVEIADRRAWHQRLRHLSTAKATILCDLFGTRDTLTLDGDPATTWSFKPAHSVSLPTAILRGSSEELLLSIVEDGLSERLGAREWWDYEGESRLLAWVLAHGFLVECLGRLLREPLLPSAWSAEMPTPPESSDMATLAFSATTADGRTCVGSLGLSPAMVSRLTTSAGWRPTSRTYAPWLQLPIGFRIELRGVQFPLAEVTAARTGDVLILGRRTRCWCSLRITAIGAGRTGTFAGSWNASCESDQLRLGSAVPLTSTEVTMFEPTPEGADATAPLSAMADIPVKLDFEVGTLSLPLGELPKLAPGYVLQLPTRLEEARVVIRANGVRIGHGELVAVGDVLGVQLLAIETNGIR
jgi:type III secretion protein Q